MSSYEVDPEYMPNVQDAAEPPADQGRKFHSWNDVLAAYGYTIQDYLREHNSDVEPLKTGIARTAVDDALNGGLRPGLTTIGGEPGAGKSALALEIAFHLVVSGKTVVYLSGEMSSKQCYDRVLSCFANANKSTLTPFAWSDAWNEAKKARAALDGADSDPVVRAAEMFGERRYNDRLFIFDDVDALELATIWEIADYAQEAGAALLVVDYLQSVIAKGYANEVERVSEVSKQLRTLGQQIGLPILALSSLNRNSNAGGMDRFRGSADIGYCAEAAMHLYKDNDAPTKDGMQPVFLEVVKNRHGAAGWKVPLYFDGAHNAYESRQWTPKPPEPAKPAKTSTGKSQRRTAPAWDDYGATNDA